MMPSEGLKPDNTFGFSDNAFRLVCMRCKEEYRAEFNVRRFADVEERAENPKRRGDSSET